MYGRTKGIFGRNSLVYVGEMLNLASSAMHFKIDRSAYYDGVGSMDIWVHGSNGMMCRYEGGSSIAPSSAYIKNVSVYKKDGRVYIYITSPDYNDSWRILDYGTRGDARFDCKVVEALPTDAELIYDLSSGKGLVGDSYLNGNKYVTSSDLKTFAYSASTSISRDEAIKELFYSLPNDNSIHTGTLYHIQTLACMVQKYVNSTYGSIIVFGYSEGLQRYTVGSNGWKKYKYAETEVTMS